VYENQLHPGIEQLLALGRLNEHPYVELISCYIKDHPYAGITSAVKFRLLHPSVPIIFFSFHSKDQLHPKDPFGILSLKGIDHVRLPCSRERIIQAAKKYENKSLLFKPKRWQKFSQPACKYLLKQRMDELKHGNKLALGNKVLNPLRLACMNAKSFPDHRSSNISLLQSKLAALKEYTKRPEIAEFCALAKACERTEDDFLQLTSEFANLMQTLANWNGAVEPENLDDLIAMIDCLNDSFTKLQNL